MLASHALGPSAKSGMITASVGRVYRTSIGKEIAHLHFATIFAPRGPTERLVDLVQQRVLG